jgi:hypothetical protein
MMMVLQNIHTFVKRGSKTVFPLPAETLARCCIPRMPGLSGSLGTTVEVVTVHGSSANQGVY